MTQDPFRLVGTMLAGKYQVDRVIGEGGFGVVYAGMHLHLGTPVAIKCLKGATVAMVHSLVREARLLFTLTHPGIVRMYDAGDHNGVPYVVLELVDGFALDHEVERRRNGQAPPMTAQEIGDIVGSMLDALVYAHAHGVVHGDLKPSNVMVLRDRTAGSAIKILDFGTALVRSGSAVTGGVGLTPKYAAPEQWDATIGKVTPATDLFAMGLVLEELSTGENLVRGESVQQLLSSVIAPKQSLIRTRRPDLSPTLADVVMRATQTRPEHRFASASEFNQALKIALAGGRPSLPVPTPPTVPQPYGVPASPLAYTSGAPPRPTPQTLPSPNAVTPAPPPPQLVPAKASSSGMGCVLVGLLVLFLGAAGAAGFAVFRALGSPPASSPSVPVTATAPASAAATATATAPVPATATATATATVPGTAHPTIAHTTPTVTATGESRKLVFNVGHGAFGGLDPVAAKIIDMVDNTHGPGLKKCFDNEHQPDAWSAIIVVRFTKDGGHGISQLILHEGAEDKGPVAQSLIGCLRNIGTWPFPQPRGYDEMDGGLPYVRISVGYAWERVP